MRPSTPVSPTRFILRIRCGVVRRAGKSFGRGWSSTWMLLFLSVLLAGLPSCVRVDAEEVQSADPKEHIRGVTISCQTWGWEWGTPQFAEELLDLEGLGVNWIAIHPYARIRSDGEVSWRAFDPQSPPEWLVGPIRDARERGMGLLVKPHLAYWGSSFSWRGAISFGTPEERGRFWKSYKTWILALAQVTREADAFVVGTELDRMLAGEDESQWRRLIADVRAVTGSHLTYAANWSDFERVPFWDALDAVGVQAYFPLVSADGNQEPSEEQLRAGWEPVLQRLRALHERVGKPVIFTELGYDASLVAALEPWRDGRSSPTQRATAERLQERLLTVALEVLDEHRGWLRGGFLWKWFVGEPSRGDGSFYVDQPRLRSILKQRWAR